MDQEIKNKLIEAFGIKNIPADKQEEALERIGKLIFQSVFLRILKDLPEAKQKELNELLAANPDPEKLLGFLTANVPNFEEIMKEEAANFQEEAKKLMQV